MRKTLLILILLYPFPAKAITPDTPEILLSETDGLSDNRVNCCIQDSRGFIWVGTATGLDLYDGQTFQPFGRATYSLLEADGKIWAGTDKGIWNFSVEDGEFHPFETVTKYGVNIISRVNTLAITDGSVIWIGTEGQGLFIYNTHNGTLTQHSVNHPFIKKIAEVEEGRVVVVDRNGSQFLYGSRGGYLKQTNEYQIHGNGSLVDREGNRWVPTADRGLIKISGKESGLAKFSFPDGVHQDTYIPIAEDYDGHFFIGIKNKLYLLKRGETTISQHIDVPCSGQITRLLSAPEGLWIGTDTDGVYRYSCDSRSFSHYPTGGAIHSLYKAATGELFVGTDLGLLSCTPDKNYLSPTLNKKSIKIIFDGEQHHDASLKEFELVSQSAVVAMCEDGGHYLYLSTSNRGIFRMDLITRGWEHLVSSRSGSDALPWQKVTSLFKCHNGIIWAGTDGEGLWFLRPECTAFSKYHLAARRLQDSSIYDLTEDDNGNLWICSSSGLWQLNPENESVSLVNLKASSIIRTVDGKLYLGQADAIISFSPEDAIRKPDKTFTVIREMSVGEQAFFIPPGGRHIRLSYKNNSFSIRLAELAFANQNQHLYSWMLQGFDNEWNAPSLSPIATYTKVPPGEYVFMVQGSNDTVRISISSPWWKSSIAIAAFVLIIIAGMVALFFFGKNRLEKRYSDLMKKREEEREKALYKQKIRFFMGLVHEIRTPLTLIRLQHEKDSKSTNDTITRNLNYMQDTINKILTYDKQASGNINVLMTRMDLRDVVSSVAGSFVDSASSEGIKLDTVIGETPVIVSADEDMVTKILTNLLSNALKYTKDRISVSVHEEEENAVVVVTDNGPGVKKDQQEKIFEMFYTSPDNPVAETSGIGVGLAYARQLAEANHGKLSVEDAVTEGASFVFRLPLVKNRSAVDNDAKPALLPSSERIKVLVVEDNRELRETLRNELSAWYDILTAKNGEDAFNMVRKEAVDVIISDVMMPIMDGFELCRKVKEQLSFSHIPVILLTAKVSLDAKSEGMESGADAFIEKPFSIRQLRGQVDNLLRLRETFRDAVLSGSVLPETTTKGPEFNFINAINDAIEKHLSDDDFSIEALASDMAMSRTNFFRKFKALTGFTPNDYLKQYRLERAARLIRGGARVNEAAESVGFVSSSYFAKCFKAHFGVLPKDYLK